MCNLAFKKKVVKLPIWITRSLKSNLLAYDVRNDQIQMSQA